MYQAGERGRANRPGEPMGRTDAGNRTGSAGTPRPTSYQMPGAERRAKDGARDSRSGTCQCSPVACATTGDLFRIPLRLHRSQGGTTFLSCCSTVAGSSIFRQSQQSPKNRGKAENALNHVPRNETERPLALVILGGLVTSTLLNLFLLPSLYAGFGTRRG